MLINLHFFQNQNDDILRKCIFATLLLDYFSNKMINFHIVFVYALLSLHDIHILNFLIIHFEYNLRYIFVFS